MDADNRALAETFDAVADLYDRVRPTYPGTLFDDLVSLARLRLVRPHRRDRVRHWSGDVAAGGTRVRSHVRRARGVTRRGRTQKLKPYPRVEVIDRRFRGLAAEPGDLRRRGRLHLLSLDRAERPVHQGGDAPPRRGTLAIVTTHHVMPPDGDSFFLDVQEDYEAVVPDDPATKAGGPTHPDTIADLSAEIAESGLFRNTAARRYLWDVSYGADDYINVLETYSGHRAT